MDWLAISAMKGSSPDARDMAWVSARSRSRISLITAAARKRSLPGLMRIKKSLYAPFPSPPGDMLVIRQPCFRALFTIPARWIEERDRSLPQLMM